MRYRFSDKGISDIIKDVFTGQSSGVEMLELKWKVHVIPYDNTYVRESLFYSLSPLFQLFWATLIFSDIASKAECVFARLTSTVFAIHRAF